MGTLTWLEDNTPFPPVHQALPEGLLAAGGDLSVARLREAYRHGIFPWFNENDPVLWWSPDPRMVLACENLRISHSLSKRLRQIARTERQPDAHIRILTDTALPDVLTGCAGHRRDQHGTWISPYVKQAYLVWAEAGAVHSVETWIDGQLAGGLYGICMGRFFFGESMFARTTDASKLALAYLVRFLLANDIHHIDCQQQTRHLATMGARPLSRDAFMALLAASVDLPAPHWTAGQLLHDGTLVPHKPPAVEQAQGTTAGALAPPA
ncbi:leucyl/phenylalanyl-tRNA--protein transferase [Pusillimonas sp. TS35]|uniref:leucyl/phenylalanyl-tRNA--protein transferase n=1 Tax=Paracandidimonas lactea TaxID=2895524 RepID=UPI00136A7A78|nr:leucyl/phenylalanyl-tRNA--protein transferase [Paracandidimonas lactea]MYN14533.1 leucyl/phenylalanyl-tRNA--protein transferase [Pusillimonas sp. TS35]